MVRVTVSGQESNGLGLYFESFQSGNGHTQRVWMTCWSSELLRVFPIAVRTGDE